MNCIEKRDLMKKLSSLHFALVELKLFLDTHPQNAEALKLFADYKDGYARLLREYEKKFGALTADSDFDNTEWDWVNGPWPWESDKEMCD